MGHKATDCSSCAERLGQPFSCCPAESADIPDGGDATSSDQIGNNKRLELALADFSHEIRTPLTAIVGFSSLLNRTDGLAGDAKVYAQLIETAGLTIAASVSRVAERSGIPSNADPEVTTLVEAGHSISKPPTNIEGSARASSRQRAKNGSCEPPDDGVYDTRPLSGLRVLIVDDHPHIRDILAAALAAFGMIISTACDGPACLEALAQMPFDVVLMDYRMPGLTGAEVLALLRFHAGPNQTVPVIAVTAELTPLNAHIFDLFDGLLTKPLSFNALAREILGTLPQCSPSVSADNSASA